jgi:uncharacterized protein YeaO (DUF488 family)
MSIHIYRYGQPGLRKGLFVGVTRHLPRGVRGEDYAARGYFDVWLPLLAPSRLLLSSFLKEKISLSQFSRRYRAEMRLPAARQAIRLLAATASQHPVHLGCFCADPTRCHRSILQELITSATKELPKRPAKQSEFFSPACAMPEIEE